MTLGLTKRQPWRDRAAAPLIGRLVDLVKNAAVAEMFGADFCPSAENRNINADERQLWKAAKQRFVSHDVRFGRPIVALGGDRLPFSRIEVFKILSSDGPGAMGVDVLV